MRQPGPEIIVSFDAVSAWADSEQGLSDDARNDAFRQRLVDPEMNRCFKGPTLPSDPTVVEGMAFGNPAGWDLAQVKNELATLRAHQREVTDAIRAALEKSAERYPGGRLERVCVFYFGPGNPVRARLGGVMGFTASAATIDLYLAPETAWTDWIGYNAAHEYNHATWMAFHPDADPMKFTLLEYLVFEGRADHLGALISGRVGPWTHAISPEQACTLFTQLRPRLGETGPLLPQVMFGFGRSGSEYPTWTGYTLGWGIVDAFVAKHPDATVGSWMALEPAAILAQGGYDPCAARP
jgi:uncharacterized protein YjaZ